jgi:hypothetical protein
MIHLFVPAYAGLPGFPGSCAVSVGSGKGANRRDTPEHRYDFGCLKAELVEGERCASDQTSMNE